MAKISDGYVEIETVDSVEVFGEWIEFKDGDGASFLIAPDVVKTLYNFLSTNKNLIEAAEDAEADDAWK
jgi:hypothetical protein